MTTAQQAIDIVKAMVTAAAKPVLNSNGSFASEIAMEQVTTKDAVDALPKLEAKSHPYYHDIDGGGQTGVMIEGHLTDDQMALVPEHIANELLDDLATTAGAVPPGVVHPHQRKMLLSSYGEALGDIVCKAIDEALSCQGTSYRRLKNYDGTEFGPLSSEEIDEPYYELVEPDAEHAAPVTSFDFIDAAYEARELIEARDRAAALARRGAAAESVA